MEKRSEAEVENGIDESERKNNLSAAVDCGQPTSNLTSLNQIYLTGTQPGATTYQSTSAVVCIPGWKWSDGSVGSKTLTCAASARWNTFSTCTSEEHSFSTEND